MKSAFLKLLLKNAVKMIDIQKAMKVRKAVVEHEDIGTVTGGRGFTARVSPVSHIEVNGRQVKPVFTFVVVSLTTRCNVSHYVDTYWRKGKDAVLALVTDIVEYIVKDDITFKQLYSSAISFIKGETKQLALLNLLPRRIRWSNTFARVHSLEVEDVDRILLVKGTLRSILIQQRKGGSGKITDIEKYCTYAVSVLPKNDDAKLFVPENVSSPSELLERVLFLFGFK